MNGRTWREIQTEQKNLEHVQQKFIADNRDSYLRYQSLPHEIREAKCGATTVEQHRQALLALTAKLPTRASDLLDANKYHDLYKTLQEKIAETAQIEETLQKISRLENEFNQLKQFIAPVLETHEEKISACENEKKQFLSKNTFIIWKKLTIYDAIKKGDLNQVKDTFAPWLANRCNREGLTPLVLALHHQHFQIVGWLLRQVDSNGKGIVILISLQMTRNMARLHHSIQRLFMENKMLAVH